jgi:hypothetical protein
MLLTCTAKGCLQQSEAKLDRETRDVLCTNCGKAISNVTEYTKKTLDLLGQVVRSAEHRPFQARCRKCAGMREIKLAGDVAHCAACGSQLQMSAAFMKAYRLHLAEQQVEKGANE